MLAPKGFIKDSTGVYRRGNYIFLEGQIINEKEANESQWGNLLQSQFDGLQNAVKAVLSYNSQYGENTRINPIYVDEDKDGNYVFGGDLTDKTRAIIDPDNNVFYISCNQEIPTIDDTEKLDNNAKAPEELKEISAKPTELKESGKDNVRFYSDALIDAIDNGTLKSDNVARAFINYLSEDEVKDFMEHNDYMWVTDEGSFEESQKFHEDENTKWTTEIIVNGELTYKNKLLYKDIQEILSVANSIEPTQVYEADKQYNKKQEKAIKELMDLSGKSREEVIDLADKFKKLAHGNSKSSDKLKEDEDTLVEEPKETPEEDNLATKSTYFIRRPSNLEELEDKVNKHLVTKATYQIADEVSLSPEEFNKFCENMREDQDFLKSFRPDQSDADFTCLAVKGPDKTLLVDNGSSDSAQYVGIL